jgi:hypothetical protein
VALLSARIPSWDAIAEQTMGLYETLVRARGNAAGVPMSRPMATA